MNKGAVGGYLGCTLSPHQAILMLLTDHSGTCQVRLCALFSSATSSSAKPFNLTNRNDLERNDVKQFVSLPMQSVNCFTRPYFVRITG